MKMTVQEKNIADRQLKGITWRIIVIAALAISTAVWNANEKYNNLMRAIERSYGRNDIQDVQIQALHARLDKIEIELRELKTSK